MSSDCGVRGSQSTQTEPSQTRGEHVMPPKNQKLQFLEWSLKPDFKSKFVFLVFLSSHADNDAATALYPSFQYLGCEFPCSILVSNRCRNWDKTSTFALVLSLQPSRSTMDHFKEIDSCRTGWHDTNMVACYSRCDIT